MTQIRTVRLELLRPGPSHNQLLSPLTPYIALCGDASPTTLRIRHEHHRFLSRLERLRYVTGQAQDTVAVPNRVREAAVTELGQDVSDILGDVPALLGELARVREMPPGSGEGTGPSLAHLSLVLGGSELALIPFELAVAPQAFPGEGLDMGLQLAGATVMLREARRLLPPPPPWNARTPKLLLVAAAPEGMEVPLAAHVHAIREAFEPWIGWPKRQDAKDAKDAKDGTDTKDAKPASRIDEVKKHIHILTNASIDAIYDACAKNDYTHVHILAHGGACQHAGEPQFGLVLCARDNPLIADIVSGRRLATALRAQGADGHRRAQPLVVTLATCDSGNTGSVLVPGGSIAHDLHAEGIPWVFASQFPLTKTGSVHMARALYPGLLNGDDPRQVLFELRRRLYMQGRGSHDWASIVAYASVPPDFGRTVQAFFEQQSRSAIDVALARADDLGETDPEGFERSLQKAQSVLDRWRAGLPKGDTLPDRERRAECFGIHGSTYKRMALIQYGRNEGQHPGGNSVPDAKDGARELAAKAARRKELADQTLRQALAYYRSAMAEGIVNAKFHWVATQALSLSAALNESPDPDGFELARLMARQGLNHPEPSEQAWAHGTLAELEMIRLHHKPAGRPGAQAASATAAVLEHCRALLRLTDPDSFHVQSTRRQFQRYVEHWDPKFRPIAEQAVAALSPAPTPIGA